jgi:hypothetical protein
MKPILVALALVLGVCVPARALAQNDAAKEEARVLLKEGVALLGEKRYDEALVRFRAGYAKFPSAALLLNIASTLKDMGKDAEAANAYQRYLDAPDATAARRTEVTAILATLDATLGVLVITTSEPDAEVRVGDGEWGALRLVRVDPGPYLVRARKDGFRKSIERGSIAAGARIDVALALVEVPAIRLEPGAGAGDRDGDHGVVARANRRGSSRFGALVDVAIDGKGEGVAVAPGVSVALHPRVDLAVKALFSGSQGAYVGVTGYLGSGAFCPLLSVGVPVFFSDGVRAGARAAGGGAW